MDAGREVGLLARKLFPGGMNASADHFDVFSNVRKTRELMNHGAYTIYEAVFLFDGCLVMADILHRGAGGWRGRTEG